MHPPRDDAPAEGGGRRVLKRLIFRAACAVGLHHIGRWLNRSRLLVVGYHGLLDGQPPPAARWLFLPRERFERQVRFLARHYRIVSLDDALAEIRAGGLREPTACITFDDGYRSNRDALPLLCGLNAPATIYLATGGIGTEKLLWTTRLELVFRTTDRSHVDLDRIGLGVVALPDPTARGRAARAVIGRLKRMAPADRSAALEVIEQALEVEPPGDDAAFAMLTWEDVAAMEATGLVRFGAHTVDHEIVSRLDDAALDEQIRASIEAVRAHVDKPSRTFAYPNGRAEDFDARAAAVIRSMGGTGAVTTIDGLNGDNVDPFALRRLTVGSDMDFDEFRLRAAGLLWPRAGG